MLTNAYGYSNVCVPVDVETQVARMDCTKYPHSAAYWDVSAGNRAANAFPDIHPMRKRLHVFARLKLHPLLLRVTVPDIRALSHNGTRKRKHTAVSVKKDLHGMALHVCRTRKRSCAWQTVPNTKMQNRSGATRNKRRNASGAPTGMYGCTPAT